LKTAKKNYTKIQFTSFLCL